MSTAHAVHPYRRVTQVWLHVRGILDATTGAELEQVKRTDEPDFGRRLIDLTDCGPWTRLKLTVQCALDVEDLRSIVNRREEPASVLRVLVIILSGSAKLRRAVLLSHEADGRYSGALIVDRDDIGGVFQLGCRIVRSADSSSAPDPSIAGFAGAIVGQSDPVLFAVDKSEVPYTGPVRFAWRDFAKAEEDDLRKNASLPMVVRTDQAPTVFLNSSIPDLRAALEARSNAPVEVALRNTLTAMIGGSVWRQLTFASVASLRRIDQTPDDDDGTPDGGIEVPPDWKGAIARSFARFAYPDDTQDAALGLLCDEYAEPEASQLLITRVGLFADMQARVRKSLDLALAAARRSGDEEQ